MAEHIAYMHPIADLRPHRSRAHVGVEGVAMRGDFDDDVVAARIVEADQDGVLSRMRDVLGHAVAGVHHRAVADAVDRLVVAAIAGVPVLRPFPGRRLAVHGLHLHPVDGVALRDIGGVRR